MNGLTTQQRKLVYLGSILVLMIPIIALGRPSSIQSGAGKDAGGSPGGALAKLRSKYELGESNLGNVDPSSSTMNLVLVGFRGIAVNQLNKQALHHEKTKDWALMIADLESIVLLQPHFLKVWEMQGWNIAYNVSASWDLIGDKYYWLKEGVKFTIRGSERNSRYPILFHKVGMILGDKMGHHDAWKYFRMFFNPNAYDQSDPLVRELAGDPDLRRRTGEIGPDPELNPDNRDNYLVAKDWHFRANEKENDTKDHRAKMQRELFRMKPAQSQIAYADVLRREGRYNETVEMANAWLIAFEELTNKYQTGIGKGRDGFGRELFDAREYGGKYYFEAKTDEDFEQLQKLDDQPGKYSIRQKRMVVASQKATTNYMFWRTHAEVEQLEQMVTAHRDIHKGKEALKEGDPQPAIQLLEAGLQGLSKLFVKYPVLQVQDESTEEFLIAILAWQDARKLISTNVAPGQNIPVFQGDPKSTVTLRDLWAKSSDRLGQCRRLLKYEFRSAD